MKKNILILSLILLMSSTYLLSSEQPFVRFPAINSSGTLISFSFQGDIWTVPVNGGRAFRVTIHEAYDSNPIFSPDGKRIVFSSNRYGNNDIFEIGINGGHPLRLTYNSSADLATGWTEKGDIIFESTRNYKQVEWEKELLSVSSNGGTPSLFLKALGTEAVVSPGGRFVAFVRGACRVTRERYKGSANRDIWIFDTKTKKYNQITKFEGQDFHPCWDKSGLFFISARSGRYNIFRVNIGTNGMVKGKPSAVTKFSDEPVRWVSVSKNGNLLVFEKGTDIYTVNKDGSNLSKVNILIDPDYRFDPVERKTISSKVTGYDVSPDGKLIAFEVRGEIFVTQSNEKKSRAVNISNNPYRDKDVVWLNNQSLIFSSDRSGAFNLYLVTSDDKNEKDLFKSLKHKIVKLTNSNEEETYPVISPDGKKIAFLRGNGKLVVADIDKKGKFSGERLLLNGWATPDGITFSPDSRWISYSLDDLNFNSEVYIQKVDNSLKPVNVSMHPRGDYSPFWSPDGSKLGFVSARHNSNMDIWFVWLKKSDWQKTAGDWEEESDEIHFPGISDKKSSKKNGVSSSKDKSDKKEIKPLKIDLDKIFERIVRVTDLPGDESDFVISKDGKKFFFTADNPGAKGKVLFSVKWDGKKIKKLSGSATNPRGIILEKSGKNIYFVSGRGNIAKADTKSGKIKSIPFKAKMVVNYNRELEQIFDEAWRMLRDSFYDPEFHGMDFALLRKEYRAKCLKASTVQDFRDMFNVMLGQLNASHMGMYGSGRESTQKESMGRIGVRVEPLDIGVKVIHVIPDSPSDRVGSKLYKDDVILEVNGLKVTGKNNFWSFLTDTSGEKVLFKVKNRSGKIRDVVIRPSSSLRSELYNEWVDQRRKLTDKYSGGKLGYLHIQGMNMPSFERFERELASAGYGKEGIVIDVRFNGGGWTTDYLMAVLNVKQHSYTIPRGAVKSLKDHKKFRNFYPFAERLPFYAWNRPSIALCNASSYSNAEIFSHAYKTLNIGTLVGKPTFGAVISTGGLGLINGMYVRKPFRAWYVKATDKNMEWGPAVPNIIVTNPPDSKSKGVDYQLKKACEILLKQIK